MSAAGHIYFLRQGNFVKIGFSTNYLKRCAAIAAYSPEESRIIAAHVGTFEDETRFHRALKNHRHKLEWFHWCPEVEAIAASGLPAHERKRPELSRLAASFLNEIETFLAETGMKATTFGNEAIKDRNFVGDLRDGRSPRLGLVDRIRDFIGQHRERAA